ncbi:unnamed protein product [Cyprideis torosa]|uniref:Uncharacterized protein n=1 Tax=Cyprideis torosa TaxID=163714 RepID=A0A7R8WDD5_9CRUS|nr:unnamed protein product [Cyprideis torosa]CAG0894516.1 unnamed protein product [Cyprideis torosa]
MKVVRRWKVATTDPHRLQWQGISQRRRMVGLGDQAAQGMQTVFQRRRMVGLGDQAAQGMKTVSQRRRMVGLGDQAAQGMKTVSQRRRMAGLGDQAAQGMKTVSQRRRMAGLGGQAGQLPGSRVSPGLGESGCLRCGQRQTGSGHRRWKLRGGMFWHASNSEEEDGGGGNGCKPPLPLPTLGDLLLSRFISSTENKPPVGRWGLEWPS